jgi:hypothetical protein
MMLSVSDVAERWDVAPAAVRTRILTGELRALRFGRLYRIAWEDVLACEVGAGSPGDPRERTALLTIAKLGRIAGVSGRTVHRWIAAGLPVRRVGANVRINPYDAGDWIADRFGWQPDTSDLLRSRRS